MSEIQKAKAAWKNKDEVEFGAEAMDGVIYFMAYPYYANPYYWDVKQQRWVGM